MCKGAGDTNTHTHLPFCLNLYDRIITHNTIHLQYSSQWACVCVCVCVCAVVVYNSSLILHIGIIRDIYALYIGAYMIHI